MASAFGHKRYNIVCANRRFDTDATIDANTFIEACYASIKPALIQAADTSTWAQVGDAWQQQVKDELRRHAIDFMGNIVHKLEAYMEWLCKHCRVGDAGSERECKYRAILGICAKSFPSLQKKIDEVAGREERLRCEDALKQIQAEVWPVSPISPGSASSGHHGRHDGMRNPCQPSASPFLPLQYLPAAHASPEPHARAQQPRSQPLSPSLTPSASHSASQAQSLCGLAGWGSPRPSDPGGLSSAGERPASPDILDSFFEQGLPDLDPDDFGQSDAMDIPNFYSGAVPAHQTMTLSMPMDQSQMGATRPHLLDDEPPTCISLLTSSSWPPNLPPVRISPTKTISTPDLAGSPAMPSHPTSASGTHTSPLGATHAQPMPTPPPAQPHNPPLHALLPRVSTSSLGHALSLGYGATMKFLDNTPAEDRAKAQHIQDALHAFFVQHFAPGMAPYRVGLNRCIAAYVGVQQVPRGALQELTDRLASIGGGRVWLQLPDGATLACSGGPAEGRLVPCKPKHAMMVTYVAINSAGLVQVQGLNLVTRDHVPVADFWALPSTTQTRITCIPREAAVPLKAVLALPGIGPVGRDRVVLRLPRGKILYL
ncbi:hypothetical protein WJX73_004981 [Symbiochloris irregularis]|uniref:Uncharacterized protein n=1 Tax=Symbiochloris irregularis TaxID=706552 RepID=A0AAW1P1J6_9CHLO